MEEGGFGRADARLATRRGKPKAYRRKVKRMKRESWVQSMREVESAEDKLEAEKREFMRKRGLT